VGSTFRNNWSKTQGGAIYASSFSSVSISGDSYFEGNYAAEKGDDIYASNAESLFQITDTSIENSIARNSIYMEAVSLATSNLVISANADSGSEQGGGIFCLNCLTISISNSRFTGLTSHEGPAVYISQTENQKEDSLEEASYKISGSTFW